MKFPILDIVFLAIVIASVLIATLRGFAKCVLSKVAFVVSILVAVSFTPVAEQLVSQWVSIKYLTTIISFVACFIIAFVVLKIIQLLIEKIFKGRVLGALDRIFGAVWGLAIGLLLSIAVVLLLMLIPVDALSNLLAKSYFAKFIMPFFADFSFKKEPETTAFILKKLGDFNV